MRKYQNNNVSSGGMGLGAVLTVIFVVLKLCGLIDWSWWWVLSPLWISFAISVVIVLIVFGGIAMVDWIESRNRRKRK